MVITDLWKARGGGEVMGFILESKYMIVEVRLYFVVVRVKNNEEKGDVFNLFINLFEYEWMSKCIYIIN